MTATPDHATDHDANEGHRLDALRAIVGAAHVVSASQMDEPRRRRHLIDWRGRYEGLALAIVSPGSKDEVMAVMQRCSEWRWPVVAQGGNTSLVGGSVPDHTGRHLVLHLGRLQAVRHIDVDNLSITVEAGCTLDEVRQQAAQAGLLFPLSLASGGQCTIGGNLATNAGGTQVLRYGTARELCLGLEVVTASGTCWSNLSGLRKDNTGYDLRDLFIGSEGTLGLITAATLKLFPAPQGCATALMTCPDAAAAVALLRRARTSLDAGLVAFEAMAAYPLQLVRQHLPALAHVLPAEAPWTVLIEHQGPRAQAVIEDELSALLHEATQTGLVLEARLAQTGVQRQAMWHLREGIPLAEKTEGFMVKHDIGLPTSAIPAWLEACERALRERWPEGRVVCFGHLGDGNLHYNVQPPAACAQGDAFKAFEREVNTVVFDLVAQHGGTISAEHGIGQLRQAELAQRAPPEGLAMMRAIKQALDPLGLLNPGRLLG